MPIEDSAAILVARFLKSNNYENTLDAFIAEANLPPDAGSLPTKTALTIERILDEKRQFDKSIDYNKEAESNGADSGWGDVAPSVPTVVDTLPSSVNLLKVLVGNIHLDGQQRPCIIASTADRKVSMLSTEKDGEGKFELIGTLPPTPVDSPVLDCVFLGDHVVVAAMSGLVCLQNLRTHQKSERRDHKKYVVKVAAWSDDNDTWIATAGWDSRILLYHVEDGQLAAPIADISLVTNPETLLFAKHHDTGRLFLLVSRRDSSSIHYYLVNKEADQASDALTSASSMLTPAGNQNLAPHSNGWVAFSPSAMALCPTDPTLLAVATSSLPHMKAIIVRLLFPSDDSINTQPVYSTQAEQERGRLIRQDYEETAIQVHISTMAPQTPYSTPQVCWRPNGRGIFVNGDDGVIRGIEAKTGKIKSILKDGHEIGSKIRSIWAGWVGDGHQEWLVSGGFDKRLVVWRAS